MFCILFSYQNKTISRPEFHFVQSASMIATIKNGGGKDQKTKYEYYILSRPLEDKNEL